MYKHFEAHQFHVVVKIDDIDILKSSKQKSTQCSCISTNQQKSV